MYIEDGKLMLSDHKCRRCEDGLTDEIVRVPCEVCKGTGDGPRGGKKRCRKCFGSGSKWHNTGGKEVCDHCEGTTRVADDYYDSVPQELWESLEFRVLRQDTRRQSWVEAHLGVGCYSITDYGDHKSKTDEELIREVREERHGTPQAVKLLMGEYVEGEGMQYDPTMPEFIGIFTNDQGYFVAAVHGDKILTR